MLYEIPLKDGLGVEFIVEREMMPERAPTPISLFDALRLTHSKCQTPSKRPTNGRTVCPSAVRPSVRPSAS